MKGFLMNAEVAEEFFLRCQKQQAVTIEQRERIMADLVKELQAVNLNEADVLRYIKSKKRVVYVKKKDK